MKFVLACLFLTSMMVPAFSQSGLTVQWSFSTGGKIFSSPTLAREKVLVGSEDGKLYAINRKNGRLIWSFATGGAVSSTPAVAGNRVFFGSLDGYYYALELSTGKLLWKFRTGGEKRFGDTSYWGMKPAGIYQEDPWDCYLSSPAIVQGGHALTIYFGSSDSTVYALNGLTGKLRWKFKTGASVHASPVVHNGRLFIGGWDTYMYALDAITGKLQWRFKTGEQPGLAGIQAAAVVADGSVYFGARDAHFYALDEITGKLQWSYDAEGSWVVGQAVIRDKILYVGTSDTYLLLALDALTGKELFRFKMNGYVFDRPAIVDQNAYVGDFTGNFYAIDLASQGRRFSKFSTESRNLHAPAVLKNDTLNFQFAATGTDLQQYANTVAVMDKFYALGSILSSPAYEDGLVYVGSADGKLYAFQLQPHQLAAAGHE